MFTKSSYGNNYASLYADLKKAVLSDLPNPGVCVYADQRQLTVSYVTHIPSIVMNCTHTYVCSAGDHYMQGQIQLGIVKQTDDGHRKNENAIEKRSSYELTQDDSGKPTTVTAAEGENESADGDTTANIPSGETVAGVKDLENLYSEIASTTRPGKDTTGRGKNENAYSDLTSPREPSDGASLGHSRGGGRGITRVPPQEALYDQPVS